MKSNWLKSIRTKLILSYFFVIILSMAVTGTFFSLRMKQVLEDSRIRETFTQADVVAGAISAMVSGPGNIAGQGEIIADRYSGEMGKRLQVYSVDGYLVADSRERNVGNLSPGGNRLAQLFPATPYMEETSIFWQARSTEDLIFIHSTWTIFRPQTEDIYEPYMGAVDISVPISASAQNLDEKIENYQNRFSKIGAQLATSMEIELSHDPDLSRAASMVINREPLRDVYRIRVYDTDGVLVASSQVMNQEKVSSTETEQRFYWYDSGPEGRSLKIAIPIISSISRMKLGSLILTSWVGYIDATYEGLNRLLLWAIGISLAVTLLISIIVARNLVRPITDIQRATERIASGDFSATVDYRGQDEIRSLSDGINYMAEKIRQDIDQITGEKEKINALLTALPEGVIALSHDGRVLFLNEAAGDALKVPCDKATGRPLWELWPHREVREFFEEGREKMSLFTRELIIPPRVFRLYLLPYGHGDSGGMMMVIRDVTDLRRLEETRTHFLGSISHELRTPLTIIKGFIHTIIDDEPVKSDPAAEKALKIIDKETDRLTRLVQDLLELSRFRSRKLSMEFETVPVDELVEETVAQMEPNAGRMGITLHHRISSPPGEIYGDRDRLKQVIINLIDNSIKYTPSGGHIDISTEIKDDRWIFVVTDNGTGIAKDELPFLFERFFRTRDKSKRQYVKGTGLGMAIVKEIVDAHHGEIHVESQEGEGTTIRVTLPVNGEKPVSPHKQSLEPHGDGGEQAGDHQDSH